MTKRTGESAGGRGGGGPYSVPRERQKVIGAQLRTMFDVVVNEPVPDEFLRLLEQADKKPRSDDDAS